AFERGLALAPEHLDLLTNLADLYLSQGRYDQASDYLTRALRVDPDDVPVLLSLGDCAIRLGVLDTATLAFQRVRDLAPETEGIELILQELAAVG
ncbi:MAG TPA: tetratricopeptide repeat protein, partial [Anaerolineae bacterium]|nr:tetratricopeptide repeat protein [Anaerolineae bacterium]